MFCTSCGTQAREGAAYCATCGAHLAAPAATSPTFAPDAARAAEPVPPLPSPLADTAYPPGYGPPPAGAVATGATVRLDPVLHLPLAPWWKRFLAIILDGVMLSVGYFVLLAVIGIATNSHSTATSTNTSTQSGAVVVGFIALFILASIPNAIYFGLMNGSRRGQTVGKIALGIAVRDARTGQPIGFWRAFGRMFITVLFELLLYIPYVLDSLAPLWDARRQAWHDKVSKTVVIDLKP